MFIRETKKTNAQSGKVFLQYVLIQSYRINGTSRQLNVLYLGSDKFLQDKELRRKLAKALEEKIYNTLNIEGVGSYYDVLEKEYQQLVDSWYAKYLEMVGTKQCVIRAFRYDGSRPKQVRFIPHGRKTIGAF